MQIKYASAIQCCANGKRWKMFLPKFPYGNGKAFDDDENGKLRPKQSLNLIQRYPVVDAINGQQETCRKLCKEERYGLGILSAYWCKGFL